jgi:ribonuclease R
MSGLVPLSTVQDDFFVFDPARNHLVGRRTRRIIRLGDPVTVQVAKVDSFKKQVDFRLVRDGGDRSGRPATAQEAIPRHRQPGASGPRRDFRRQGRRR